jgi:hypothetical protein
MSDSYQKIDHAALKTNQALIIGLSLLAFLLDLPWLAAGTALAMLAGTLLGQPGFGWVYRLALRPLGWVKPEVLLDHPEPHRFAQGLGGAMLLAGGLSAWAGLSLLGWGLTWVVIALAALNLFAGFCAGCAVYYWLGRLGAPGFSKRPPAGTAPGMRSRLEA